MWAAAARSGFCPISIFAGNSLFLDLSRANTSYVLKDQRVWSSLRYQVAAHCKKRSEHINHPRFLVLILEFGPTGILGIHLPRHELPTHCMVERNTHR